MCKVLIQLKQNCRRTSPYKITSILFTDGHMDTWTDTDRQADSSMRPQNICLRGHIINHFTIKIPKSCENPKKYSH